MDSKILLIEDEFAIRRFLRAGISGHNFELIEAATGKEGIQFAATHNPSLILLDLGLPDIDGLEVVTKVREWSEVPIIVLSARGQESDKIAALDRGADDYLTKPFSMGELFARVRSVLRRSEDRGIAERKNYKFGELEIDVNAHTVTVGGNAVHLTPKEFQLLVSMVRFEGCVLTHKQLLTEVWGKAYEEDTHYLRVFMKNLRHKIEKEPARPQYIITEPGVGYRFCGTVI